MRRRRDWKTVRVLAGRQEWLAALALESGRSIADVLEDILGEYESSLALSALNPDDRYDLGEGQA